MTTDFSNLFGDFTRPKFLALVILPNIRELRFYIKRIIDYLNDEGISFKRINSESIVILGSEYRIQFFIATEKEHCYPLGALEPNLTIWAKNETASKEAIEYVSTRLRGYK